MRRQKATGETSRRFWLRRSGLTSGKGEWPGGALHSKRCVAGLCVPPQERLGHHDGRGIAPWAGTHSVACPHPDPNIFAARQAGELERARVQKRFRIAPPVSV